MVQATEALVECFADLSAAVPTRVVPLTVAASTDERQLLKILDDCLSVFEIFGVVPVALFVSREPSGHSSRHSGSVGDAVADQCRHEPRDVVSRDEGGEPDEVSGQPEVAGRLLGAGVDVRG